MLRKAGCVVVSFFGFSSGDLQSDDSECESQGLEALEVEKLTCYIGARGFRPRSTYILYKYLSEGGNHRR